MAPIDDKLFEDFFSHLPGAINFKGCEPWAQCNICGHHNRVSRMTMDEDRGWVDYACLNGEKKQTKQDENWDAINGITGLFSGGKK